MNTHNNGVNNVPQHPKDNTFSFFQKPIKGIKDATPRKNIDLKEVYNIITSKAYVAVTAEARSLIETQYKAFKAKKLDYCTFHGTFKTRGEDGLISLSGFICIDADNLGNNLQAIKERLIKDTALSPQLIFISPSNNGLKIVLRIDAACVDLTATSNKMQNIWQAVNAYLGRHFADLITPNAKNHFIDAAGMDVSRACFLCYDADAYLNINDTILGNEFIEANPPIEITQVNKPAKRTKAVSKVNSLPNITSVNPATTLDTLAARHLLPTDNHTPELLKFIGAALAIGTPVEQTKRYLNAHAHVSPKSSKSETDMLDEMVEDVYNRYGQYSEVVVLTPLSIGYQFLYLKYSKDVKLYVLTSLYLDAVRSILHHAGYAKRKIGKSFIFIQKNGCVICEVTPENMRDYFTNYVNSIAEDFCFTYQGNNYTISPESTREIYLKNSHNIFNEDWLEHLQIHDEPVLRDTESEMFFFFKNALVTVTKDGISTAAWEVIKGFCIWDEQLIQHDFLSVEDYAQSHFFKFLQNVTNDVYDRFITMLTGIGYLLHHYFRESEGQAVIFYDEEITDTRTPMGGTGKGLIVHAVQQVRKAVKIDGKHLLNGNRFRWEMISPGTQVIWLDDVTADFDFAILHSCLTDGWTVERKYLPQFFIPPKDSPKTVICSNSIVKGGGTTNKRRQFIIELSNFYSKQIKRGDEKPIEQTHGCLFFGTQWDAAEWNRFFCLMMNAAHQYLKSGLIPFEGVNVEKNRFRQATGEDFATWVGEQKFEQGGRYPTKEYFDKFINIYYGNIYQIGQRTFTGFLKAFAYYKKWDFNVYQSNGLSHFQF